MLGANTGVGITAFNSGTRATLEGTIIRDTRVSETEGCGHGATVFGGARLELIDCAVLGSTSVGVAAYDPGTNAHLTGTTVLGTLPSDSEIGIGAQAAEGASLVAEGCEILENRGAGVLATGDGTEVVLTGTCIAGTLPTAEVGSGHGVEVHGGATMAAYGCSVLDNTAIGIVAAQAGTSVVLQDTEILHTQPNAGGDFGYGIQVSEAAALGALSCRLDGNTGGGVVALHPGTTVRLEDTSISNTLLGPGEQGAAAPGAAAMLGASLEASGISITSSEGPGLHAAADGALLLCEGCSIQGAQFAGAVVLYDASMVITASTIEDISPSANLGGGVGVYADHWGVGSPALSVSDTIIQDSPIAGILLMGEGSYQVSGSTIHGGLGEPFGDSRRCGDAIHASGVRGSGDGSFGLYLADNAIQGGLTAGLLLEDATATLSGNSWSDNAVDLVSQGVDCATPPAGYDSEPLGTSELCPTWDYPTCRDRFSFVLDVDTVELLLRPSPPHHPSRTQGRYPAAKGPPG